ncbi:MAG: hypothetical protein AABY88_02085 [Pseudomonadota bacterium]
MKKLVKLDDDLNLTEIDWKATRRQAEKLRDYILSAPDSERRKYEYEERLMPMIDAVFDGSIDIPWRTNQLTVQFSDPYPARFIMEGQAPQLVESFSDIYLTFKFMIEASASQFSLSTHESGEYILGKYRVEKDDELYEWCWFED